MEIPLLTKGESKVYQALLELGESPIGGIIKNSSVSHSKIYDILKRLAKKGLVSTIIRNGR
jgi:sugar-specific transcriptional regulator TrmB